MNRHGGALRPVLLIDSDGDEKVDRSLRGRIDGELAVFDAPQLASADLRRAYWQVGIVYVAGEKGAEGYDGRFVASTDSRSAKVRFDGVGPLPPVGAGA